MIIFLVSEKFCASKVGVEQIVIWRRFFFWT